MSYYFRNKKKHTYSFFNLTLFSLNIYFICKIISFFQMKHYFKKINKKLCAYILPSCSSQNNFLFCFFLMS